MVVIGPSDSSGRNGILANAPPENIFRNQKISITSMQIQLFRKDSDLFISKNVLQKISF